MNKLITCAVFLNQRNQRLAEEVSGELIEEDAEAKKSRIISLLNTNKKRKYEQAMQVESAAKLAQLDVATVLSNLRLPIFLDAEDIEIDLATNGKASAFGNGERPDDPDFDQPPTRSRKRSKRFEDDVPTGTRNSTCGKIHLSRDELDDWLIHGRLDCPQNVRVTASQVFGQWAQYIQIENEFTVEENGIVYLLPTIQLRLKDCTSKRRKFKSRGSFLAKIGFIVQFEY